MSTWLSRGNSGRSLSRPRLSGSPPRCSWSSRKELLSKLSHSSKTFPDLTLSSLSLLLFPSPYYATTLSPPHLPTSPPLVSNIATRSLTLVIPVPPFAVPFSLSLSLFSFLLFFHSSVERLVPRAYPHRSPVAAGSSPFTARFRLPLRSDVARMHESKGGGAHMRVWERTQCRNARREAAA